MTRVHAFTDDALGELDTVDLVAAVRDRKVSPAELVEAAIARVEHVDPTLGGVAYAAFDRARDQAQAPPGGFFAGIPTFVKDNVDVAGMPTQEGSDAFRSGIKPADGDFARMFLATGLITLGKTQLSEFGFSASAEHPRLGSVRNPWNPDYSAGASSSGAAALVAAGAVPLAHANDGGGSIRIPAAANGLVGLKPTRGRLAQDKRVREMPVRIVADGVVTRSVRDTAAFFRESERVYRNLRLPPIGDVTRPGKGRLRIALVSRSVDRECTPEVLDELYRVGALLESLGHHVEHVEPPVPAYFPRDFLLYWGLLSTFLLRIGSRAHGDSWDLARTTDLSRGLDAHVMRNLHRLPLAITRLGASKHLSARFHRTYDVALSPTLAHATPRLGHLAGDLDYETVIERLMDWVAFTPLQNATGDPSISLPLARTAEGMPMGMMFSSSWGREATLLSLAYELEEASPFARIHGPVDPA